MQTLSANQQLHQRPRQASRCKGSQVEQTTPFTTGTIVNGFLKNRFLPKCEVPVQFPDRKMVEATYFQSVKRLSNFYNVTVLDISGFDYPYNVLLSHWDISQKIKVKGRFRELKIDEENYAIKVSVEETINTGYDLYYIPIAPLYKCYENGANEWIRLLLGVCVYLYRKAGVCHYRDSESYICYLYDIMDNWIEDDRESMDDIDYQEQRANLDEMFRIGDKIEPILADEEHLLQLQTVIKTFQPQTKFEKGCVQLAKDTLAVWMEFPTANLYMNLGVEGEEDDDYYGTGKILLTDYISFIGEVSGPVYETMKDMTNQDFNERSGVQDFVSTVVFDKRQGKYKDHLGYEEKVIAIITDLCNLLTELP